jgi:hypothetical protein
MAATAVLLTAVALLLTSSRPESPANRPRRQGAATIDTTAVLRSSSGGLLREATQVTGRFITSYLAYTHGHGSAAQITGADHSLAHSLRSTPLSPIPPGERARHPRIVSLEPATTVAGRLVVAAIVSDGGLIDYTLTLTLQRDRDQLLVTSVDGER